jgi:LDH2 family malate/lactate/ureidoglycolate dehydrogenase
MIIQPASKLMKIGIKIFTSLGLSTENARFVTDTIVEASLSGHDSHGVLYFPVYAQRIRDGHIKVDAEPVIVKETPSSALVDGKWAFGQVTAFKLTKIAVEKCKRNMVASVGAFNCNHIGRLGYYTSWASDQGIIALMFANVGHPIVSAYNGFGPAFGTNPLSVSVPTGSEIPFLVDYATSIVAGGKLSVARDMHQKIPLHWTRNKHGQKNQDPNVLSDGGWLLPFGGHKGYGLQVVSEILGAVLTGSRLGLDDIDYPPASNGTLIITLNPEAFVGLDLFRRKTSSLLYNVKNLPALTGERVFVPGEPEKETKAKRLEEGIPLPTDTWDSILVLCDELDIDIERL